MKNEKPTWQSCPDCDEQGVCEIYRSCWIAKEMYLNRAINYHIRSGNSILPDGEVRNAANHVVEVLEIPDGFQIKLDSDNMARLIDAISARGRGD